MNVEFFPGDNIAIKVPPHHFEETVRFYRDILRLEELALESPNAIESRVFQFGDKQLWIDRVDGLSQAETWFEIVTDDIEQAARYLEAKGVSRRDEIEPLPEGFKGFWISAPSDIIHLINQKQ